MGFSKSSLPIRSMLPLRALRHVWQWPACEAFLDQSCQKVRKRRDILVDARLFEGGHVALSLGQRDHSPWVSARGRHAVHQEPCHATVAVHIGVDVHEDEMPE